MWTRASSGSSSRRWENSRPGATVSWYGIPNLSPVPGINIKLHFRICHGKPTFKGTRIMVWQVLDELAHGMTPDKIVAAWGGKVSRGAIAESVQLARESLLDERGRLRHPEASLTAA